MQRQGPAMGRMAGGHKVPGRWEAVNDSRWGAILRHCGRMEFRSGSAIFPYKRSILPLISLVPGDPLIVSPARVAAHRRPIAKHFTQKNWLVSNGYITFSGTCGRRR